ncbi:sensor histidine kinase [Stenotrophomonas mori]|uniref:Histidine kinase n=1 Tax=Stenotrophomonas mori TaxID=2871096 RepID=A0ABT0SFV8_9GAMM|nr:histidine kinase [Stenotrophomonas mori]MCL7714197.1 histidine kinase [Stenotrophomonas mori]
MSLPNHPGTLPPASTPALPDSARQRPLDVLFRPAALIAALLVGEAVAALLVLSPQAGGDRLVAFGLLSLAIQWVTLGTLGVLHVLRRPLERLQPQALAWACLGLMLLTTLVVALLCWQLLDVRHEQRLADGAMFVARALALALVAGLLALLIFQSHWRAQRLAVAAKQAELDALQARIHPHFLFNTLNTAAALVHQQPEQAEQLLLDLSELFRAALAGPRPVGLHEELQLARRYAEIEQLRFGARMRLEWDLPETLPALSMPPLTLQPLVENAIHHGVERTPGSCLLRIAVVVAAAEVTVTVSNALPPVPTATPARSGHGLGLRAVRERVQAHGGSVVAQAVQGQYRVSVRLPLPPPEPPAASPPPQVTTW